MTIAASVEAILTADASLVTLLTGGIYTYQETKRLGLNKTTVPAAYDANGFIKPCALVKQRSRVPTSAIKDAGTQTTSEAAVIEAFLYSDGNDTPPETAANRVYVLLHDQIIAGGYMQLINQIDDWRDETLDFANLIRLDFSWNGIRQP